MQKDTLCVNSYNPFAECTLKTRVRQLLHTHQGRDKLFKVIMYLMRIVLWYRGIDANPNFMANAAQTDFTRLERNLMTIQNARRLFRVGRFVAEFVRIRVTLIKCSELLYTSSRSITMSAFLQSQMVADIAARLMMCIKSVCDDVAYMARKGFLHSTVENRLLAFSVRFYLPVLLIDAYLNLTRLAQGLVDARIETPAAGAAAVEATAPAAARKCSIAAGSVSPRDHQDAFSLLSRYDKNDKLRRRQSTPPPLVATAGHRRQSSALSATGAGSSDSLEDKQHPSGGGAVVPPALQQQQGREADTLIGIGVRGESFVYSANTYRQMILADVTGSGIAPTEGSSGACAAPSAPVSAASGAPVESEDVELVNSYWALCWKDFELHWVCVTQLKIMLDLFVALSIVRNWGKQWNGAVSIAGFISGLLSVYRVWTYGR